MAENTTKIILNASADGVLRAAEQVKKKFTEVGEAGGKAGEKMLVNLGKSLLTAGALMKVVKGVAEAFNEAAANAAKISKETGGRTLSAETAGQKLGMSSGQVSAMMSQTGTRTQDERAGFMSALAGAKGPGGKPLDSAAAIEAFGIFNSGGQEQSELLDSLQKNGKRGLAAAGNAGRLRIASYGDRARSELFARQELSAEEMRIADTAGASGENERVRTARMASLEAENPGAFMFRNAVKAAGGEGIVNAGDRWLSEIAGNTRPRLNSSANGP